MAAADLDDAGQAQGVTEEVTTPNGATVAAGGGAEYNLVIAELVNAHLKDKQLLSYQVAVLTSAVILTGWRYSSCCAIRLLDLPWLYKQLPSYQLAILTMAELPGHPNPNPNPN